MNQENPETLEQQCSNTQLTTDTTRSYYSHHIQQYNEHNIVQQKIQEIKIQNEILQNENYEQKQNISALQDKIRELENQLQISKIQNDNHYEQNKEDIQNKINQQSIPSSQLLQVCNHILFIFIFFILLFNNISLQYKEELKLFKSQLSISRDLNEEHEFQFEQKNNFELQNDNELEQFAQNQERYRNVILSSQEIKKSQTEQIIENITDQEINKPNQISAMQNKRWIKMRNMLNQKKFCEELNRNHQKVSSEGFQDYLYQQKDQFFNKQRKSCGLNNYENENTVNQNMAHRFQSAQKNNKDNDFKINISKLSFDSNEINRSMKDEIELNAQNYNQSPLQIYYTQNNRESFNNNNPNKLNSKKITNLINNIINSTDEQNSIIYSSSTFDCSNDSNIKAFINEEEYQQKEEDHQNVWKYQFLSNQIQKIYEEQKQLKIRGTFLFEEFMVLGPNLRELEESLEQNPQIFNQNNIESQEYLYESAYEPILFCKPSYTSPYFCKQRKTIASFAFPQGLKYKIYQNQTNLNFNSIHQQNNQNNNKKIFILNTIGEDNNSHNLLSVINPQQMLYAICYQEEDYYVSIDEDSGEETVFVFPVVYCFCTYYPFINFFVQTIQNIVSRIKTIRLNKINSQVDNNIQNLQNADLSFVIRMLHNDYDLCISLKTLQMKEVQPKFVVKHQIQLPQDYLFSSDKGWDYIPLNESISQQISYKIPQLKDMEYIESLEAAYFTFSNLPFYDFQFILTMILLEQKIVFLSENITLLTYTTLTFQSLLKPFIYPYTIQFCLNSQMLDYLGSPTAFIYGVNQSSDEFLQSSFGKFDDIIYIDLDKNQINTHNKENISQKLNYNFHKFYSKIESLFSKINNKICSKHFNKFTIFSHKKKIIQNPNKKQLSNLKKLLKLIQKSFQHSIVNLLPNNLILKNNELDMDRIKNCILTNNPEIIFLQEFTNNNQTFQWFIEQYYF